MYVRMQECDWVCRDTHVNKYACMQIHVCHFHVYIHAVESHHEIACKYFTIYWQIIYIYGTHGNYLDI